MTSLVSALRSSILLFLLLAIFGSGTASSADAQVKLKGALFADKTSFQSADQDAMNYAASPDKLTFTMTFSNMEAVIGSGQSGAVDAPVATKVASLVIPVTGQQIDATIVVDAGATTQEGTGATLMLVVNDKSTAVHVPAGANNKDVELQLRYRAKGVSDLRITILAVVDRDQAHPGSASDLTVDALNGMMAGADRKPAKKH